RGRARRGNAGTELPVIIALADRIDVAVLIEMRDARRPEVAFRGHLLEQRHGLDGKMLALGGRTGATGLREGAGNVVRGEARRFGRDMLHDTGGAGLEVGNFAAASVHYQ